jgi:cyclic pyranopterin phosphate synthase
LLEQPDSEAALKAAIRATVWDKWAGHEINRSSFIAPQRPMYSIGG